MKVLILKQNQPVIEKYIGSKIVPIESTANTMIFKISTQLFRTLYAKVRDDGYNPYALMHW
jgi:hypothetical protein